MADDQHINGNGNGSRLNRMADNAAGKLLITYVIPVLAIIAGYLIQSKLEEISSTQKLFWGELGKFSKAQSELSVNLAVTNSNINSHARDDDVFERATAAQLADHEARLRAIQIASPRLRFPPN